MSVKILGKSYDINTKELDLGNKGISQLPESIGKLVNLQYIDLRHNQLTVIPETIGELVNLQYLDLSFNRLAELPKSIGKLVRLEYLFLTNNQLISLPESIGKLVKLEYLQLDNNLLTILPASILNIKESLELYVNAYEINNLLADAEFLIFTRLSEELTNLPTGLKEIWIKKENKKLNHKLPFGCKIKYF
jgi:Leucine-rich repeat (LRR) protein